MKILAIETSCDETAASIIDAHDDQITVCANVVSSQVALRAKWGGVVPNLAAREHTKNIIPVLSQTLQDAHMTHHDIDLLAVTQCPGLIPALLSGVSATKTLAYAWHKPLIGIHHIEGHVYANWIDHTDAITFPALALFVSGGHTQLMLMRDHCTYEVIGETQDDAVGEAFDKVARILGLGYPGGPIIAQRAEAFVRSGAACTFTLPRPMLTSGNLHFSFSGLKTSVLYLVKEFRTSHGLTDDQALPDTFVDHVAYAFQESVVDVLVHKTIRAAQQHTIATVLLAGGVSANTRLREKTQQDLAQQLPHIACLSPTMTYCVDNAAMIATAAYYRYTHSTDEQKEMYKMNWKHILATARCAI